MQKENKKRKVCVHAIFSRTYLGYKKHMRGSRKPSIYTLFLRVIGSNEQTNYQNSGFNTLTIAVYRSSGTVHEKKINNSQGFFSFTSPSPASV